MSDIFICGTGVVSPAGWGMQPFRDAIARGTHLPTKELPRPGHTPLHVRQVPPANPRPTFLAHARLRRTSSITHYAVNAALEALGADAVKVTSGALRLGIIYCSLTGCVNYSRRFYDEVLKDPSTASPLVFPETVYNSPASHLAALIGTTGINYTLIGDPGTFLQGVALAADWLTDNRVDGCLVIGAEEMDWLTAGAVNLFEHQATFSDGAGALYLRSSRRLPRQSAAQPGEEPQTYLGQLKAVTNSHLYTNAIGRAKAIRLTREELQGQPAGETLAVPGGELLCDGLQGASRADEDERIVWRDWPGDRLSVKTIFGEGLMAATAWQCAAAVEGVGRKAYAAAQVSVPGTNQQAIAARFAACSGGQ